MGIITHDVIQVKWHYISSASGDWQTPEEQDEFRAEDSQSFWLLQQLTPLNTDAAETYSDTCALQH